MKFSFHASERLKERSTLDPSEIITALREDRVEIITAEEGTNRVSYLFFSASEEKFHILVIDKSAREIITIMPIEYWENLKRGDKKSRFLNGRSVTLCDLFDAVRKVDANHTIIQNSPILGRRRVYFFAYYTIEEKRKREKIGFMDFTHFLKSEKGECVTKLESCLETNLDGLNLKNDSITIIWKATAGKKSNTTDSEHLIQFNSRIDFDMLYESVLSDILLRVENAKRFPDFQWVFERNGNS